MADAQAGNTASAAAFGERALILDAGELRSAPDWHWHPRAFRPVNWKRPAADWQGSTPIRHLRASNRSIVLGMVGDLNDALGESARAFKAYEAANAELAALNPTNNAGRGRRRARTRAAADRRSEFAEPANWHDGPVSTANAAEPSAHVFLVGFPRSGTTLLENVLAHLPRRGGAGGEGNPGPGSAHLPHIRPPAGSTWSASTPGRPRTSAIAIGRPCAVSAQSQMAGYSSTRCLLRQFSCRSSASYSLALYSVCVARPARRGAELFSSPVRNERRHGAIPER